LCRFSVKKLKMAAEDANGIQEEKGPSLNDQIVRQIEVKSLWTRVHSLLWWI